jgi:putative hemolysin
MFEWLFFLALLLLSALFSAAETSYTVLDKRRLRAAKEAGNRRAAIILFLWEKPERFFTPLLIANSLAATGATFLLTTLLIHSLGAAGPWLATVLVAFLLLFFAELLPKGIAARFPRRISLLLLPVVLAVYILFWPVSWVVNGLMAGLRRLFPSLQYSSAFRSRQEIETLAAAWGGEEDQAMFSRTLRFAAKRLGEVMVPRVAMHAFPVEKPALEILREAANLRYSRFPLYLGNLDRVTGVLHLKDLLGMPMTSLIPASQVARDPLFLPENLTLARALEEMRLRRASLALVVDERGGTAGLVTMEDLAEEIVGEIWDEYDSPSERIQACPDGSLLLAGQTTLAEISEHHGMVIDSQATTLGGAITERLGRFPVQGEEIDLGPVQAKILLATPKSVERVLLRKEVDS